MWPWQPKPTSSGPTSPTTPTLDEPPGSFPINLTSDQATRLYLARERRLVVDRRRVRLRRWARLADFGATFLAGLNVGMILVGADQRAIGVTALVVLGVHLLGNWGHRVYWRTVVESYDAPF